MTVWTVGHSTHSLDELCALLAAHGIERVADVRSFPASRRNPHFARAALERSLPAAGVGYVWLPALGGRRRRRPGSPHTAWRVAAFAGYADHMDTDEFRAGIAELLGHARAARTAVMCAEARPEQCHRRLIADWLTAHGVCVEHIRDARRVERHALPPFARVDGDRLLYDAGQPSLALE